MQRARSGEAKERGNLPALLGGGCRRIDSQDGLTLLTIRGAVPASMYV